MNSVAMRHAVAEGDRSGLVEQQRIDIAGRLDGPAGGGDYIEADQTIHPGNADRREQAADGGGDQGDQQSDEHDDGEFGVRVAGEAVKGHNRDEKDQGHAGEQDGKCQLVRCLLALRAFDERDHAVYEGGARRGSDADDQPIREDHRTAGHGGAVAARFTDDGRGFAGDGTFID
jgi:hypothetical protein